jgi:hypothetical protein
MTEWDAVTRLRAELDRVGASRATAGAAGTPALSVMAALTPSRHHARGANLWLDWIATCRASPHWLQLIDTTNGSVQTTLDLRQTSIDGLAWGALAPDGPGDWTGDNIVLPNAAGALLLSANQNVLRIDRVARFNGDPGIRGAEYHEARYLNTDPRQITGTAAPILIHQR